MMSSASSAIMFHFQSECSLLDAHVNIITLVVQLKNDSFFVMVDNFPVSKIKLLMMVGAENQDV